MKKTRGKGTIKSLMSLKPALLIGMLSPSLAKRGKGRF